MQLYTIGHSAHPIQRFIDLLQMHHIQVLVDVRSTPASRWHPQYNKAALQRVLEEHGIAYVFAGQQLGGRPKDPTCYDAEALADKRAKHPRANFAKIMERDWFVRGIADLVMQVNQGRTAILCSEEDPLCCHRHALIARYLRDAHPGIEVRHIRKDGSSMSAMALFSAQNERRPRQLRLLE